MGATNKNRYLLKIPINRSSVAAVALKRDWMTQNLLQYLWSETAFLKKPTFYVQSCSNIKRQNCNKHLQNLIKMPSHSIIEQVCKQYLCANAFKWNDFCVFHANKMRPGNQRKRLKQLRWCQASFSMINVRIVPPSIAAEIQPRHKKNNNNLF